MRLVLLAFIVALSQVPAERVRGPVVDFTAVQADGTPVPDLRAEDVEIRIGDRVRTIRTLRRISAAALPSLGSAPPPPYGTNDNVTVGRRFILLIDQESLRSGREPQMRSAVEGFAAQLTPLDATMVATLPLGGVRLPFTSEPARVRRAVEAISGQAAGNETGSEMACRTRRFLESLEGFLGQQPAYTRPYSYVIFTAGMAAPRRDAAMAEAAGMCELQADLYRRVGNAASAARANIFLLQPSDIGMTGGRSQESINGLGYTGSDNPLEGIEALAGVTGAARLPLDATGTASLLRVAKETSGYYEAELAPEPGDVVGRSRPFAVKVVRRGVTVRARPQFTLTEPPRAAGRLTVSDLLGATEPLTDVRLRVGGFTVREGEGRLRVGVLVEPVDPATTLTSVAAILISPDDRVAGRWFAKDATERPLLGAIAAPPGSYRLRVVALDTAGGSGAAEDTIEVGLTTVGPLSLGSLMFGVSRPEGMRPQLAFRAEPTAIASFDVYGGESGMALSAVLEIARDGEGLAILTVPLALKRSDASRVVATGAVPIGALPPGDYVVRGIIKLQDGTIGKVTRTLRKAPR